MGGGFIEAILDPLKFEAANPISFDDGGHFVFFDHHALTSILRPLIEWADDCLRYDSRFQVGDREAYYRALRGRRDSHLRRIEEHVGFGARINLDWPPCREVVHGAVIPTLEEELFRRENVVDRFMFSAFIFIRLFGRQVPADYAQRRPDPEARRRMSEVYPKGRLSKQSQVIQVLEWLMRRAGVQDLAPVTPVNIKKRLYRLKRNGVPDEWKQELFGQLITPRQFHSWKVHVAIDALERRIREFPRSVALDRDSVHRSLLGSIQRLVRLLEHYLERVNPRLDHGVEERIRGLLGNAGGDLSETTGSFRFLRAMDYTKSDFEVGR